MIFWIEGLVTIFIGFVCYFLLTKDIDSAKWLTQEEKLIANARLKSENPATTVVIEKARWRVFVDGAQACLLHHHALIFHRPHQFQRFYLRLHVLLGEFRALAICFKLLICPRAH